MIASPQEPVVQCIALTKVFGDFWGRARVLAVDRLDLEITPGEIFGLLGPNGSGKSTTIKMLLGLLYPTSGAARIFGRPPTDTAIKARVGFMPEESYLYRYLNAIETLDYCGKIFKLDRRERQRRIGELVDMVGLKRAARRPVGTYSKGMARRIGLAQALINDPDLLILDEPTTGLDPVGTRQIKDLIKILGQRGKTVLLCSHLLADVEDVCDRVAIMYGGRRQAIGRVEDLLTRQDVTQITTSSLSPDVTEKIRHTVEAAGGRVLGVDHPTDRLEGLFMRVVGQAQREKLETSGAESTGRVSAFLGGPGEEGESLIDSLVKAGSEAPEPDSAPSVTAPGAPAPRKDVLERLGEPAPVTPRPPNSVRPPPPAADQRVDRSVLDRLIAEDAASAPPEKPESTP